MNCPVHSCYAIDKIELESHRMGNAVKENDGTQCCSGASSSAMHVCGPVRASLNRASEWKGS
jgi:hypothetical protein